MPEQLLSILLYFLSLIPLTLGTVVICGFAVRLCSRLFAYLSGTAAGKIFDITSVIGTPVHECGHALMCLLFGHKITAIKLWSPGKDGTYGYVEHRYNRKNLWARLGNLFIGLGPIFSGLSVTVLVLWLCYPAQWEEYLASTGALMGGTPGIRDILSSLLSLILAIPRAFAADWLRALVGLPIILSVSLHVSLSWPDIKGSLSALPLYLFLLAVFAGITGALGLSPAVTSALGLFNLRLLSLFCLVIAFSALWVVLALLFRLIRTVIGWF